jgi:hypothetical protein
LRDMFLLLRSKAEKRTGKYDLKTTLKYNAKILLSLQG